MVKKRKNKQQEIPLITRGRPRIKSDPTKTQDGLIAHIKRPVLSKTTPIHINIKVEKNIPTLRSKKMYNFFKAAVKKARLSGLAIIHFAIISNHLHLIIEASSNKELTKGMRSFLISLAMRINNFTGNKGNVFQDRYNMELIEFPRRMHYLLKYVFNNQQKHSIKNANATIADPYSSLVILSEHEMTILFKRAPIWQFEISTKNKLIKILQELLSPPTSWIARTGWKRATVCA